MILCTYVILCRRQESTRKGRERVRRETGGIYIGGGGRGGGGGGGGGGGSRGRGGGGGGGEGGGGGGVEEEDDDEEEEEEEEEYPEVRTNLALVKSASEMLPLATALNSCIIA